MATTIGAIANGEAALSVRTKLNQAIEAVETATQPEDLPAYENVMSSLIYDPGGRAANAFDLSNQTGILDGGVFT
jgi:hypothetical protein